MLILGDMGNMICWAYTYAHLADNSKINQDRYYKVCEMFSNLNRAHKTLPATESLSIN